MKQLKKLADAIRTISEQSTLSITGVPGSATAWKGTVSVGGIVLIDATGSLEEVVAQLISKLEKMSKRMLALRLSQHPPAPPENLDSSGIHPASSVPTEQELGRIKK